MLIAYAVENLLKAGLIKQNRDAYEKTISEEHILPHDLKSPKHRIMPVVRRLNIKISTTERKLLQRLSRTAFWQGRYPIPTVTQDIHRCFTEGKTTNFVGISSSEDIDLLELIVERIKTDVTSMPGT
jgi:hypothetical protein